MGEPKPARPATFRTFDNAVAYLECDGWRRLPAEVAVFTRRVAKARVKREGSVYKVVYSKRRTR